MLDPRTQELINYPNTNGKIFAMKYFNWDKLTKVEEAMKANEILKLAKELDKSEWC